MRLQSNFFNVIKEIMTGKLTSHLGHSTTVNEGIQGKILSVFTLKYLIIAIGGVCVCKLTLSND